MSYALSLMLAAAAAVVAMSCQIREVGSETLEQAGASPVDTIEVGRVFRAGDSYEVLLDGSRAVEQISVDWNGRYYVREYGPDGQPLLNDEGRPRFRDGIYASARVDGQAIGPAKFVDREEVDNWYDLAGVQGTKLRLSFTSAMASSDATVLLRRVFVRYRDPPNLKYLTFAYASGDSYLDAAAARLNDGGLHGVRAAKEYRVYRVDVRWGDAKPRDAQGIYQAGRASARLEINGIAVGALRNVAALETQVWTGFSVPATAFPRNQFAIRAHGDDMRIHWIRLYYE